MGSIALDGLNQVGNEVGATLVSRLEVSQCSGSLLLLANHGVVRTDSPTANNDDCCDNSDKCFVQFHIIILFNYYGV